MNNKTTNSTKRIVYMLGVLAMQLSAQAASFDCGKAQTKVERLICADIELSKLDEELNTAYKIKLQGNGQPDAIRQEQKQWMSERNNCSDAACVKQKYESRLSSLPAINTSTGGNDNGVESLIGSWDGVDTASMSIYGTLKISNAYVSWGKNKNYRMNCKLGYQIQKEKFGATFLGGNGQIYVIAPNSKFTTFLLKITNDNCATGVSYFRFSSRLEDDKDNYLSMIEYNESAKEVGWLRFRKRKR